MFFRLMLKRPLCIIADTIRIYSTPIMGAHDVNGVKLMTKQCHILELFEFGLLNIKHLYKFYFQKNTNFNVFLIFLKSDK